MQKVCRVRLLQLCPRLLHLQSFSNVNPLVSLQVLSSAEALPTLAAVVRFLPRVDPLVFLQVSRLAEAPPTLYAAVRLLPCVTPLVDPQVGHPAERFPTHYTEVEAASADMIQTDFSTVDRGSPVAVDDTLPPIGGEI